jgi:hypothetical protein
VAGLDEAGSHGILQICAHKPEVLVRDGDGDKTDQSRRIDFINTSGRSCKLMALAISLQEVNESLSLIRRRDNKVFERVNQSEFRAAPGRRIDHVRLAFDHDRR